MEKEKQVEKCCGDCGYFAYELTDGSGVCLLQKKETYCGFDCNCGEHAVFSKCVICKWFAKDLGVCCCADSSYCADFPPHLSECEWFELLTNKNEE